MHECEITWIEPGKLFRLKDENLVFRLISIDEKDVSVLALNMMTGRLRRLRATRDVFYVPFQIGEPLKIAGLGTMEDERCVISGRPATGYVTVEYGELAYELIPMDLQLLGRGQIGGYVFLERYFRGEYVVKDDGSVLHLV